MMNNSSNGPEGWDSLEPSQTEELIKHFRRGEKIKEKSLQEATEEVETEKEINSKRLKNELKNRISKLSDLREFEGKNSVIGARIEEVAKLITIVDKMSEEGGDLVEESTQMPVPLSKKELEKVKETSGPPSRTELYRDIKKLESRVHELEESKKGDLNDG